MRRVLEFFISFLLFGSFIPLHVFGEDKSKPERVLYLHAAVPTGAEFHSKLTTFVQLEGKSVPMNLSGATLVTDPRDQLVKLTKFRLSPPRKLADGGTNEILQEYCTKKPAVLDYTFEVAPAGGSGNLSPSSPFLSIDLKNHAFPRTTLVYYLVSQKTEVDPEKEWDTKRCP